MGGVDIRRCLALSCDMGRLIFDLSEEERAALERLRIRFGLRSHAETLRQLIRDADGGVSQAVPAPKPSFSHGRSKTVVVSASRATTTAVAKPAKVRRDTYPDWMRKK